MTDERGSMRRISVSRWVGVTATAVVALLAFLPASGGQRPARAQAQEDPKCFELSPSITGSENDDNLEGTPGDDVIMALGGNDKVFSGDGNDVICGGPGDDYLNDGIGDDQVDGGEGTDNCQPESSAEVFKGCEEPVLCFGQSPTILGSANDEELIGSDDSFSSDVIMGLGGDDKIYGLDGNDVICGGPGDDYIDDGFGDDQVDGGPGEDSCQPDASSTFGEDFRSCEKPLTPASG